MGGRYLTLLDSTAHIEFLQGDYLIDVCSALIAPVDTQGVPTAAFN